MAYVKGLHTLNNMDGPHYTRFPMFFGILLEIMRGSEDKLTKDLAPIEIYAGINGKGDLSMFVEDRIIVKLPSRKRSRSEYERDHDL